MNQDRFAGLFGNGNRNHGHASLRGFATNPLADSVTPAQALLYHAAYEQALRDTQEPESPYAECWN
jgi:hypothetical protein